jgi:hypothetical protein
LVRATAAPALKWSWGLAFSAQDFCNENDGMVQERSVKKKIQLYGTTEGKVDGSVDFSKKGRGRDDFIMQLFIQSGENRKKMMSPTFKFTGMAYCERMGMFVIIYAQKFVSHEETSNLKALRTRKVGCDNMKLEFER